MWAMARRAHPRLSEALLIRADTFSKWQARRKVHGKRHAHLGGRVAGSGTPDDRRVWLSWELMGGGRCRRRGQRGGVVRCCLPLLARCAVGMRPRQLRRNAKWREGEDEGERRRLDHPGG